MAKTTYMIAHGASVVIVREGKRISVPAGGGADFTESEILAINKAAPGSLRNPVNEGRGKAAAVTSESDEDESKKDEDEGKTETAAQKKKRLAAEKKAAEEAANKSDDSDDDDDEDI